MTDGGKKTRDDAGAASRQDASDLAATRAKLALDAGRMGSWCWDIVDGSVTGDPFVATLLDMDYDAQPWPVDEVFASMHPEDLPRVMDEVNRALDGADIYEVEFRDTVVNPQTSEEGLRWLGARGSVTRRDASGKAIEMIGVNWDVTEQKTQEERLAMLASEMDHRVKNAFAVIRALINLGRRSQGGKDAFATTLKAQVQAMADAHSISARLARRASAPSTPVPVANIVHTALAPWLETDLEHRTRTEIALELDESVLVTPRDVSPLAMLIYELATNATKYGPLGQDGGRLDVAVRREGADRACLVWRETGADPTLPAAAELETTTGVASGFGSMLVQHCAASLQARIKRELTPRGLEFEIHMPVKSAD